MKLLASRGAALARARSHTPGTLIPGFVILMLKGLILTVSLILAQAEKGEAQTTENAALTTPAGATHGALVNGNLPRASSANQLTDSGIAASSVATATNTQTLQNKSISGAQNTLTNIPAGALAGTVPSANGGAGTVTGALKGNGAGVVSQAGPGDIAAANATQGDVNISISSATRTLSVCATLTAARTATLPPANSLPAGQSVRIVDCGGSFSAGGSDTILPAGSDTENGATASGCTGSILCQVMAVQGAVAEATTDGVSNWNVTLTLPQAEPALPIADSVISLPNLVGKTSATACIVDDSTGMEIAANGYIVDPSQSKWWMLKEKLKHDLPNITWTFQNFAFNGMNDSNFLQTGTQINSPSPPAWFTDLNQTWASYVQAANCDIVFWGFGTNAAISGQTSGNSVALFLRQDLENINSWAKVPKVIFVINKQANPATDTSGDDSNESAHKAQAAFKRSFARSNAGGYTSFPNITALKLDYIDLGRGYTERNDGHDPVAQYLQLKPSCVVNGFAMIAGPTVGTDPSTICTTTHGDYAVTFTRPSGGVDLFNEGGGHIWQLSLGGFFGNYLRFTIGSLGGIQPRYVVDNTIGGPPSILGSTVSTTQGQLVTVNVSVSQEHLVVTINGTVALDVEVPRFVSEMPSGTPINLNFNSTPTGSPTANITAFYEGIGFPTQAFSSYTLSMGPPATCSGPGSKIANCQGGNGNNHQRDNSAALDRQIIDAMRFAVPAVDTSSPQTLANKTLTAPVISSIVNGAATLTVPSVTGTLRNIIAADGSAHAVPADTTEDTLATITIPANAMGANGCLQINTLWSFTGSTNTKTLRVRFSGSGGTVYMGPAISTSANVAANYEVSICNRNATNSQIGLPGSLGLNGQQNGAPVTSSVDTTAATTVVITGQKTSSGETLQLERYQVML